MNLDHKPIYIFITGGVVSSLGKGIAAASIGMLLESRGLTISLTKLDPYINVDSGTMNPYQHGEVFVTADGAETDLDLGHYERFTTQTLSRKNNFTAGKVYNQVIQKERQGAYLGKTVQVIPHVTDQIKTNILAASCAQVNIIEVGGTVGDIESLPFLEAIRQFRYDVGLERTLYIHLTLIPWIDSAKELKTKPTQHSVNKLREIGIQPELLLCRTDRPLNNEIKEKLAIFTNVNKNLVFTALDVPFIYQVPFKLHQEKLDQEITNYFKLPPKKPKLTAWKKAVDAFFEPKAEVQIGIVGKYLALQDSYKSLFEALQHACLHHKLKLNLKLIDSEQLADQPADPLEQCDGILIPGGFGTRGFEGKVWSAKYARTQKVPFFGICLGFQAAVIEFARNQCDIQNAQSAEFITDAEHKLIDFLPNQQNTTEKGGTMRLGTYVTELKKHSKIANIYKTPSIQERHRHRYEMNNEYVKALEEKGVLFAGYCPESDVFETLEIPGHPWFIAVQYHPEFQSRLVKPHPLFVDFIKAAYKHKTTV